MIKIEWSLGLGASYDQSRVVAQRPQEIDRKLNWLCKNNQLRTWFEEKHHIVQPILTERVC